MSLISNKELIERVARAICTADKTAPDPDANIIKGMKNCKAWEGRIEMAIAAINEIEKGN